MVLSSLIIGDRYSHREDVQVDQFVSGSGQVVVSSSGASNRLDLRCKFALFRDLGQRRGRQEQGPL